MPHAHATGAGGDEGEAPTSVGAFASYLAEQLEAQSAYGVIPTELEGESRVEFIRWNILAAMKELSEMLDHVDSWKPWQTKRENAGQIKSKDKYVEEGVDVLKFLGNALLASGATDDDLNFAWEDKTQVNTRRQEVGYAGNGDAWDKEHRS